MRREVCRGKSEHQRARAPANGRAGRPDGRKCNRKQTAAVSRTRDASGKGETVR